MDQAHGELQPPVTTVVEDGQASLVGVAVGQPTGPKAHGRPLELVVVARPRPPQVRVRVRGLLGRLQELGVVLPALAGRLDSDPLAEVHIDQDAASASLEGQPELIAVDHGRHRAALGVRVVEVDRVEVGDEVVIVAVVVVALVQRVVDLGKATVGDEGAQHAAVQHRHFTLRARRHLQGEELAVVSRLRLEANVDVRPQLGVFAQAPLHGRAARAGRVVADVADRDRLRLRHGLRHCRGLGHGRGRGCRRSGFRFRLTASRKDCRCADADGTSTSRAENCTTAQCLAHRSLLRSPYTTRHDTKGSALRLSTDFAESRRNAKPSPVPVEG